MNIKIDQYESGTRALTITDNRRTTFSSDDGFVERGMLETQLMVTGAPYGIEIEGGSEITGEFLGRKFRGVPVECVHDLPTMTTDLAYVIFWSEENAQKD